MLAQLESMCNENEVLIQKNYLPVDLRSIPASEPVPPRDIRLYLSCSLPQDRWRCVSQSSLFGYCCLSWRRLTSSYVYLIDKKRQAVTPCFRTENFLCWAAKMP